MTAMSICLSDGQSFCLSLCRKNEIKSFCWMFVENSQISIIEHQSIRLSIEGNENRMCIENNG